MKCFWLEECVTCPKIIYNLVSIDQISKDLNCKVTSFPHIVFFKIKIQGGRLDLLGKEMSSTILKLWMAKRTMTTNYLCPTYLKFFLPIKPKFDSTTCTLDIHLLMYSKTCFLLLLEISMLMIFIVIVVSLPNTTIFLFHKAIQGLLKTFSLIHTSIWCPSKIPNVSRKKWFVSFINDCTRVTWLYFMKEKSEVSNIFPILLQNDKYTIWGFHWKGEFGPCTRLFQSNSYTFLSNRSDLWAFMCR